MIDDVPTTVAAVEVVMPRLPASTSDAAFSVIKLDAQDLEGRQRVDQALSAAPGVSLFRRNSSLAANPTTQGVSLRSIAPSGAGRALVTVDGVPQNDPFGGWVIWAGLPTELFDGVDIVRGGGAGPYGAGALTGVINLRERARPGFEIDGRAGSLNSDRLSVVGEHELGPVDLLVAGSIGDTDGYIPVREGRGAADKKLSEHDWSGTVRLTTSIGSTAVSFRANAFDEDRGSGLVGADAESKGQAYSLTFGQAPTPQKVGFRVQGWVRTSDLSNSSVSVQAGRVGTGLANNQYRTPATGYGLNAAVRGGDAGLEWEIGADGRVANGDEHELFSAPAGVFTRNREAGGKTTVAGVYAEGAKTSGDWLFTGGVRADQWTSTNAKRIETLLSTGATVLNQSAPDRDGWLGTARAGVRRKLNDQAYLRAAAYAGFRPPTLNELHRPFRVGNDITEANALLKPERLFGGEAAWGWNDGATTLEATAFWNRVEDAVTNVTVGVGPGTIAGYAYAGFVPAGGVLRQRQNAGQIDAYGVEFQADHRYSDALTVHLAGAYTHAEVDGGTAAPQLTGLDPAQAPAITVTGGVTWRPMAALSVDLRGRWESARFEDDLNSRKLHAAGTVDARVGWKVTQAAEIYVAADNLFDEAVQTGQTADGVYSYGAPRIVSIGFNIRR